VEIKVRPLIVTDVFAVAHMLSKVTKGARVELASAMSAKKKPDPTELGMVLFQSMFSEAEEDLKAWMADLIGKPREEFEVMKATTVIDIIEALIKQEDIRDFFGRVSSLVNGPTKKESGKPTT